MTSWGPNATTPFPAGDPGAEDTLPETAVQLVDDTGTHVAWIEWALGGYGWRTDLDGAGITGAGQVEIPRTDPLVPTITYEHRLRFWFRGTLVHESLIEPRQDRTRDQTEEAGETVTFGGRGTLALLDQATVDPLDFGRPQQTVRYNFGHPRYDDSWWPDTSVVVDDPTYAGTFDFPIPVPLYDSGDGDPVEWTDPPDPMWGPDGEDAPYPAEDCYFRKTEDLGNTATTTGRLRVAINNAGKVIWDGEVVLERDGNWNYSNWRRIHEIELPVTSGSHTVAIVAHNIVGNTEDPDDAGRVFCRLELISTTGAVGTTGFESGTGWTVLEDPSSVPGWTWGEVITDLVTEAQGRDAASELAGVTLDWTDPNDSASDPMVVYPEIDLPAGSKVLAAVMQAAENDIDVRMAPGDVLSIWNKGGYGSAVDPVLTGIVALSHPAVPPLASRIIADWADGWVEARDETAIAAGVYREERVQLTPVRSEEQAQQIVDSLLAVFGRERVSYDFDYVVTSGPVPWLDFKPGDVGGVPSRTDPTVGVEARHRSLVTSVDGDGNVSHHVSAGDLLYDQEERFHNWLARLAGNGALGGRALVGMPFRPEVVLSKIPIAPPSGGGAGCSCVEFKAYGDEVDLTAGGTESGNVPGWFESHNEGGFSVSGDTVTLPSSAGLYRLRLRARVTILAVDSGTTSIGVECRNDSVELNDVVWLDAVRSFAWIHAFSEVVAAGGESVTILAQFSDVGDLTAGDSVRVEPILTISKVCGCDDITPPGSG